MSAISPFSSGRGSRTPPNGVPSKYMLYKDLSPFCGYVGPFSKDRANWKSRVQFDLVYLTNLLRSGRELALMMHLQNRTSSSRTIGLVSVVIAPEGSEHN